MSTCAYKQALKATAGRCFPVNNHLHAFRERLQIHLLVSPIFANFYSLETPTRLQSPHGNRTKKVFAMALGADELASTQQLDTIEAAKSVRGGVLIVALVKPPPTPGMPRVAASFPSKALMNLVADLCDGR